MSDNHHAVFIINYLIESGLDLDGAIQTLELAQVSIEGAVGQIQLSSLLDSVVIETEETVMQ